MRFLEELLCWMGRHALETRFTSKGWDGVEVVRCVNCARVIKSELVKSYNVGGQRFLFRVSTPGTLELIEALRRNNIEEKRMLAERWGFRSIL